MGNAFKIMAGNFHTDGSRNFFGQMWQAVSRYTWELPNTVVGHTISQSRNLINDIDRVDLWGGVTYSSNVNPNVRRWGMSIGNHINMQLNSDNFDILNDGLPQHEYGHTFDSRIFGPFYLFIVGIPSAIEARVANNPNFYTERWADRHAARYF
ncbi:MAG: hypothetical protein LRY27_01405 [Chitinophagales bacterium]|nr:hypothetical protein [Chitinophagales bacterium]